MEAVLRGADAVRRGLWRIGVRTRLGRACVRSRRARVATLAGFHLLTALSLTLVAPLWLLLLGPLLLGVPHVLGDLRYLLLSRYGGPGARRALPVLLPLAAMTALRVGAVMGWGWHAPRIEVLCGLGAVLGALAGAGGSAPLRLVLAGAALMLGGLAVDHAGLTALVLAHLHNAIGFGLWLYLAHRQGVRGLGGVALAFGAAIALLLSGAADGLVALHAPAEGFDAGHMVATLAPGLDPTLGLRLVLVFAFAQAVHYAVWIRLVPGSLSTGPAAPSIRRATRDLVGDVGRPLARLALIACVVVPLLGVVAPVRTRAVYLSVVLFHGWLELAMVARFLGGRAVPR